MVFHIITLFPEMFDSYLNESILARAKKEKKIDFKFYDPRDFVKPTLAQKGKQKPYLRIDDKPYGGGPGMVMQALPVIKAIERALKNSKSQITNPKKKSKHKLIWLSPSAKQFDTGYAKNAAKKYTDIIIVCGRYEGIDARVKKVFRMDEVSAGPFVLTGGELPAMVIMDAVSRQIDGVLGNYSSLEESRIASSDVYTRPEVLIHGNKKYKVPKVLLSGNHGKIEEWRSLRHKKRSV